VLIGAVSGFLAATSRHREASVHNGLVRFRSGMYIPAGEPNDDAPQEVELALPVAAEDQPRHWYQRHCDCEDRKL